MSWMRKFIVFITCRSCKVEDVKVLEERNKLRKKVGKNKIVPLARTDLDLKVGGEGSKPKGGPISWDIFSVERKEDSEALTKFARNYVKTVVIPGAVERFQAEQERDKNNGPRSSFEGASDISRSVSDLVQTSLTNAQNLLKQEQEMNKEMAHKDKVKDSEKRDN